MAKKKMKKKAAKKKPARKAAPKKTKKTAKKLAKKAAKKSTKKGAKKPTKKALTKAPKKLAAPEFTLKVGERAPDFSIFSEAGTNVSLSHFPGKTVVLYFYPKDDTPGCTKESCDFRDSFGRVTARGIVVLGVSRDSVASHVKFKQKYSLPFSLLSDEDGTVCEAYGVWKEKMNYGKTYMGIERTTFLLDVDANGKATVRQVYPKVKVEGHVDEILKELGA